jgi:hypothetical protein
MLESRRATVNRLRAAALRCRHAAGMVGPMRMLSTATVLVWLGIMAFFAGVVAPAAFSTLDREAAGRDISAGIPP